MCELTNAICRVDLTSTNNSNASICQPIICASSQPWCLTIACESFIYRLMIKSWPWLFCIQWYPAAIHEWTLFYFSSLAVSGGEVKPNSLRAKQCFALRTTDECWTIINHSSFLRLWKNKSLPLIDLLSYRFPVCSTRLYYTFTSCVEFWNCWIDRWAFSPVQWWPCWGTALHHRLLLETAYTAL